MAYDCPEDIKKILPPRFWGFLMKIPALRYMKAPVDIPEHLYREYPTGNERGSFAYVYKENAFYAYHNDGADRAIWKPVSGLESVFDIPESDLLTDGDVLIWSSEKEKFVVVNITLWATEEW